MCSSDLTPAGKFPRYLVVNGDESEPGTYKDRLLMERDPHQLIEGCLIACYAAGLSQCFLYIRGEMALAHERVGQALNEAYAAGYIGKNILGTKFSVDIALHWGAGAYVVGEETALIESLEGKRGEPRLKPPYFPAAIGLYVALPSLGGVVLAWPVSAASDDLDRRAVGVAICVGAAGASALLLLGSAQRPMAMVLITLVGGLSYPLYSISAAYTNDWIEPEHVNAAAGQLVKLYGIGAIVGPFAAGGAMSFFGPRGFYWELIAVHVVLAVFFTYRMVAWRSPFTKRPWDEVSLPARAFFVPATIISIGLRRVSRDSSAAKQP